MLYIKIYLKKVEKSIRVFLDEVLEPTFFNVSYGLGFQHFFYTRTRKLVLEKYFLKRENNFLSVVSNCVIFSYFGR